MLVPVLVFISTALSPAHAAEPSPFRVAKVRVLARSGQEAKSEVARITGLVAGATTAFETLTTLSGPDGMTKPALRTATFQKAWDREDRSPDKLWGQSHRGASQDAEFWGRRTDHATGQNAIYFKANPKCYRDNAGAVRLLEEQKPGNVTVFDL